MTSAPVHIQLTNRQENLCEYGGAFGALLSLTCLIQHLIVTRSHWIAHLMLFLYVFAIVAFLLLAFKQTISPILVIVSTVFSLAIQVIWMKSYAFSLVVLSLFLYHVIMVVVIFAESLPAALKRKRIAEIEEEMRWAGRI